MYFNIVSRSPVVEGTYEWASYLDGRKEGWPVFAEIIGMQFQEAIDYLKNERNVCDDKHRLWKVVGMEAFENKDWESIAKEEFQKEVRSFFMSINDEEDPRFISSYVWTDLYRQLEWYRNVSDYTGEDLELFREGFLQDVQDTTDLFFYFIRAIQGRKDECGEVIDELLDNEDE